MVLVQQQPGVEMTGFVESQMHFDMTDVLQFSKVGVTLLVAYGRQLVIVFLGYFQGIWQHYDCILYSCLVSPLSDVNLPFFVGIKVARL
jgi:hypothetical protein